MPQHLESTETKEKSEINKNEKIKNKKIGKVTNLLGNGINVLKTLFNETTGERSIIPPESHIQPHRINRSQ